MIIDISPAITNDLKVWPGDTPPQREVLAEIGQGSVVLLSTLRTSVHCGAHADAPNHYGKNSSGIGERSLEYYLGRCQVIHVTIDRSQRIQSRHISVAIQAERVLLVTNTFPDPYTFNEDFAALSKELIEFLAEKQVKLIGIDTPSIDLFSSKDLEAHQAVLRNDMAILEGLTLNHVPAGVYELIALPLKLMGYDASPVRAVLRTLTY